MTATPSYKPSEEGPKKIARDERQRSKERQRKKDIISHLAHIEAHNLHTLLEPPAAPAVLEPVLAPVPVLVRARAPGPPGPGLELVPELVLELERAPWLAKPAYISQRLVGGTCAAGPCSSVREHKPVVAVAAAAAADALVGGDSYKAAGAWSHLLSSCCRQQD